MDGTSFDWEDPIRTLRHGDGEITGFASISDSERVDRKRVALFATLIAALFPIAFILLDLVNGRQPLYLNNLLPLGFLFLLAPLIARAGPTRLVVALLLFTLYAGFVCAVIFPGGHGVFAVIFFSFAPFTYLIAGRKIGRRASIGLGLVAGILTAVRAIGLVGAWNIAVGFGPVAMAFITLLLQNVIADANERRHGRNMTQIVRRHYFDAGSDLANANLLREATLEARESLLVVRVLNFEDLRVLLGEHDEGENARRVVKIAQDAFPGVALSPRGPYRVSSADFAFVLPAGIEVAIVTSRLLDQYARECLSGDSPLRFSVRLGFFRAGRSACPAGRALDEAFSALADARASGASVAIRLGRGDEAPLSEMGRKAPLLLRNIREKKLGAVFQPVYDVLADGIGFFEALVRLESGGVYVSPEPYLGVSARLGLDSYISDFILDKASEAAKRSGHSVSLNVSYRDLERPSFLDRLLRSCAGLEGEANCLIVELTEHEVFADLGRVREIVALVHAAGGLVFLDDFGSGYSNYASLIGARFDAVKVAGEIVREIALRDEAATLYEGIAAFCGSAGIELVAEHVSDEAILGRALQGGARFLQGFLFSRPVDVGQIENVRFTDGRNAHAKPITARSLGLSRAASSRCPQVPSLKPAEGDSRTVP